MSGRTAARTSRRARRDAAAAAEAPRVRFQARLRPWEVAALLEWLAASLRAGTLEAEVDGEVVSIPVESPVRLRLGAERHAVGGRLRVRLYWESSEHGAITIEPA